MSQPSDPFRDARRGAGHLTCPFNHENIPLILRHEDVRRAARDWNQFSSDAPFRVPVPSEEGLRTVRQLPIETDPPDHAEYRALVEPFFNRAKDPAVTDRVEMLVTELLGVALARDSIDVVREFALPLQSRALTYLLNVPESEAAAWIGWGTHVFHDGGPGEAKGAALEKYLHQAFDRAVAHPGEDFFSALTRARFRGRPLTRPELMGYGSLTFAGGRDTVIHTVASVFGYLASRPEALAFLRADPQRVVHAAEEFFRVVSPLTHIGRVCPHDTSVGGACVKAGERISLAWASANMDESVFSAPTEVRLDRRPNPHVAFGFGPHLCLGAPHARLLIRTLLRQLAARVASLTVHEAREHAERTAAYTRAVGYEVLRVSMRPHAGRQEGFAS